MRKMISGMACLLVFSGTLWAADKEVSGKIIKLDPEKKTLSIALDKGKKDYTVDADTKVFDADGKVCKDGLKDKKLIAQAKVKIVLAANGKLVEELHLQSNTVVKDPKLPKIDPKKPNSGTDSDPKKIANGIKAKIVKVDLDKKSFTATSEDGKKLDFSIGEKTQFIGPRGGVSKEKIKDDRFTAGAEVTIVTDKEGKAVEEIHLPFRKKEKDDKKKDK